MAIIKRCKEECVQVVLTHLNDATDLSLIEVNYIVFLDPMTKKIESTHAEERLALSRIYSQGSDRRVHLTRFIVRNTEEDEHYRLTKFEQ